MLHPQLGMIFMRRYFERETATHFSPRQAVRFANARNVKWQVEAYNSCAPFVCLLVKHLIGKFVAGEKRKVVRFCVTIQTFQFIGSDARW